MSTRVPPLSVVVIGLVAFAVLPALAADGAGKRPGFIEVEYHKSHGESGGPTTELLVFGRRIESLKVKASYGGETATATTRESNTSSTDFNGHAWVPRHDGGRRELLNTIKKSIDATGAVTLKLIGKNDSGTTKQSAEIEFSECHLEPPIYPFTCIVEL
jgi:hypothetical protein